ncbi:MAG: hypothetical protein ACRD0F_08820, partial [Acidimicrobiales bacterium]
MVDVGLDGLGPPGLHVQLIGPFRISAGGTEPLALPAGKATTVARVLVVNRGSLVPVDTLADLLW